MDDRLGGTNGRDRENGQGHTTGWSAVFTAMARMWPSYAVAQLLQSWRAYRQAQPPHRKARPQTTTPGTDHLVTRSAVRTCPDPDQLAA